MDLGLRSFLCQAASFFHHLQKEPQVEPLLEPLRLENSEVFVRWRLRSRNVILPTREEVRCKSLFLVLVVHRAKACVGNTKQFFDVPWSSEFYKCSWQVLRSQLWHRQIVPKSGSKVTFPPIWKLSRCVPFPPLTLWEKQLDEIWHWVAECPPFVRYCTLGEVHSICKIDHLPSRAKWWKPVRSLSK